MRKLSILFLLFLLAVLPVCAEGQAEEVSEGADWSVPLMIGVAVVGVLAAVHILRTGKEYKDDQPQG